MRVYRERVSGSCFVNIMTSGSGPDIHRPLPVPVVDGRYGFAKLGTKREKVLAALITGDKGADIARKVGCSPALITQTRKAAAKRGLISLKPGSLMVEFADRLGKNDLAELRQEALAREITVDDLIGRVILQVARHNLFPDILGELE